MIILPSRNGMLLRNSNGILASDCGGDGDIFIPSVSPFPSYSYNTSSDVFYSKTSYNDKRDSHACGWMPGYTLVTGGYVYPTNATAMDTSEKYDHSSDSWSYIATMSTVRKWHIGKVLNSKMFVACGNDNSTFLQSSEEYNFTTNTWASGGSISSGREKAQQSTAVIGDTLYCAGGRITYNLGQSDKYQSGAWSTLTNTSNYGRASATGVIGAYIYKKVGPAMYQHDVSVDSWTTKTSFVDRYSEVGVSDSSGIGLNTDFYTWNSWPSYGGLKYNAITDSWSYISKGYNMNIGAGLSIL